jgi:hypothetical protein
MRVFVLAHTHYCAAHTECGCVVLPGRAKRRVPSSLTLAANATVAGLPDAVLEVPEIARAVRAGELQAVRVAAPGAARPGELVVAHAGAPAAKGAPRR